jgi:hypothetical protein
MSAQWFSIQQEIHQLKTRNPNVPNAMILSLKIEATNLKAQRN